MISVGTAPGITNGVFGDVTIVNSLTSTGALRADVANPAATLTADSPNTITYTSKSQSGKDPSYLFGNAPASPPNPGDGNGDGGDGHGHGHD